MMHGQHLASVHSGADPNIMHAATCCQSGSYYAFVRAAERKRIKSPGILCWFCCLALTDASPKNDQKKFDAVAQRACSIGQVKSGTIVFTLMSTYYSSALRIQAVSISHNYPAPAYLRSSLDEPYHHPPGSASSLALVRGVPAELYGAYTHPFYLKHLLD